MTEGVLFWEQQKGQDPGTIGHFHNVLMEEPKGDPEQGEGEPAPMGSGLIEGSRHPLLHSPLFLRPHNYTQPRLDGSSPWQSPHDGQEAAPIQAMSPPVPLGQ